MLQTTTWIWKTVKANKFQNHKNLLQYMLIFFKYLHLFYFSAYWFIAVLRLAMYAVEFVKLLVIDLPLLFVFRDIVNHFGLEITVDLVRAVDLKVVVIPGRIRQFNSFVGCSEWSDILNSRLNQPRCGRRKFWSSCNDVHDFLSL